MFYLVDKKKRVLRGRSPSVFEKKKIQKGASPCFREEGTEAKGRGFPTPNLPHTTPESENGGLAAVGPTLGHRRAGEATPRPQRATPVSERERLSESVIEREGGDTGGPARR